MADTGRADELLQRGEALRRAVKWIGERRLDEPTLPFYRLVDEAGKRFDLSPLDEEFLLRNFAAEQGE